MISTFNIVKPWMKTYTNVLDYGTTNGLTLPSYSQMWKQNKVHRDMHNTGAWDICDVGYLFATDGSAAFARVNHLNPGSFNCTEVSSPTFTTNVGYKSVGAGSYLDTNWQPTDGVHFTQNSAGVTIGVDTNFNAAEVAFGNEETNGGRRLYLVPRNGGNASWGVNHSGGGDAIVVAISNGTFFLQRTGSVGPPVVTSINRDGVSVTATNSESGALGTQTVPICAFKNYLGAISSPMTSASVPYFFITGALNSTQWTGLSATLIAYKSSL